MTDKEILLDLLDNFAGSLHWTIKDLPPVALSWQPDAEANSIGVTVWHICRSLDVLRVCILQNRCHGVVPPRTVSRTNNTVAPFILSFLADERYHAPIDLGHVYSTSLPSAK